MLQKKLDHTVHAISYDYAHRLEHFSPLEPHEKSLVIMQLSAHVQSQLLAQLSDQEIIETVDHLDPNEATDILQHIDIKRQNAIVEHLNERLKHDVATLLNFDPETAAGLMNVDYVQVETTQTIGDVAKLVKKHENRTGKIPTILVVQERSLVGQLPAYNIALAETDDAVEKHTKKVSSISHTASHKKVMTHFKANPHSKVVVTGENNQILGVIYTDDVLRLLQSSQAASLYNFAGVSTEESIFDSTSRKVSFRYKWLMLNLGTAFLAAFTVGLFDETISKHVLLAVYMPIVAGMGGNAATQTLAVMVRGLAQHDVDTKSILQTLKNEVSSGFINGSINAVIVTAVIYLINRDLLVGLVLGSAMIFNLCIAGFFGTLVPVVMKRLGKDPASSATIFITTATDIFGFLAFLGLATLLLS